MAGEDQDAFEPEELTAGRDTVARRLMTLQNAELATLLADALHRGMFDLEQQIARRRQAAEEPKRPAG